LKKERAVSFFDLVNNLQPALISSLGKFKPELALCITIVVLLLVRLPSWGWKINAFYIALPGALIGLFLAAPWEHLATGANMKSEPIFDGLLIYDGLTVYFRSLLLLFAVLFLFLTQLSGIPDREESPDMYTLVLGATLGMCIMASANHLLMVFLGVEMASVPSYVLAGLLKGRRKSSEAALKYSIYGAGTAGVMLYGISLIAGALGSVHLPTLAAQLASLSPEAWAERQTVLMMGGLMLMVGLAFKLSAVPFHFWCPDVFEGASAEVNAFLSIASKAAALALLLRVAIGFSHVPAPTVPVKSEDKQVAAAQVQTIAYKVPVKEGAPAVDDKAAAKPQETKSSIEALKPVRTYIATLIGCLAALTCTFGNLAAYSQTNIKRLLAYSTIAHAGYMMMPVAAAIALIGKDQHQAELAVAAVPFYMGMYLFLNLGAFAVVAFLRNVMRSEEIADYAGMIRRAPGVAICFSIILFSLIGLPPFNGFWAKLQALMYLWPAEMYWLLIVGGLNTVISLFYYLRIVKVMTIDPEPEDRLPFSFPLISAEGVYLVLMTAPVVVLGVWWEALNGLVKEATKNLLS
jgi:NADH-quinone oxidoreductase subunit N